MDETDLIALIERLAGDDPLTTSTEGLSDGCFFCGADTRYFIGRTSSIDDYNWAEHDPDCVWVEARRLLGHDITPHKVEGEPST
jgi:hypothetical protein